MSSHLKNLRTIQIINVPLDLGASRRGTDAGPSAFRIAGLHPALEKMHYKLQKDIDINVPIAESRAPQLGSAKFKEEILSVCHQLGIETLDAMNNDYLPLVIGGDHSIAMGSIAGISAWFKRQQQSLGVIWFDAHGDMNTPETSPSGNIHGMPLAHLLGYGDPELANLTGDGAALNPKNVVLIGLRDIDAREKAFIRDSGVTFFTMRDIDQLGMAEVSRRALAIVNDDTAGFHLSFDLDGCDPQVIPGTGTVVEGGVSFREAHQLLEDCAANGRMRSMEVVELNPFLDQSNISAKRAVGFIESALGKNIL